MAHISVNAGATAAPCSAHPHRQGTDESRNGCGFAGSGDLEAYLPRATSCNPIAPWLAGKSPN